MQGKAGNDADLALQQAYRALALADRDRLAAADREAALAREIAELRKLIDDWFRPHVAKLEHANADLRHRCREAEAALAAQKA